MKEWEKVDFIVRLLIVNRNSIIDDIEAYELVEYSDTLIECTERIKTYTLYLQRIDEYTQIFKKYIERILYQRVQYIEIVSECQGDITITKTKIADSLKKTEIKLEALIALKDMIEVLSTCQTPKRKKLMYRKRRKRNYLRKFGIRT